MVLYLLKIRIHQLLVGTSGGVFWRSGLGGFRNLSMFGFLEFWSLEGVWNGCVGVLILLVRSSRGARLVGGVGGDWRVFVWTFVVRRYVLSCLNSESGLFLLKERQWVRVELGTVV